MLNGVIESCGSILDGSTGSLCNLDVFKAENAVIVDQVGIVHGSQFGSHFRQGIGLKGFGQAFNPFKDPF